MKKSAWFIFLLLLAVLFNANSRQGELLRLPGSVFCSEGSTHLSRATADNYSFKSKKNSSTRFDHHRRVRAWDNYSAAAVPARWFSVASTSYYLQRIDYTHYQSVLVSFSLQRDRLRGPPAV